MYLKGASTDRLHVLPDIKTLQKLCKSLAVLNLIYDGEGSFEYYNKNEYYNKKSDIYETETFVMNTWGGNFYKIYFNNIGSVIIGFDHESNISPYGEDINIWPGIIEQLPKEFTYMTKEFFDDEYNKYMITFCIWRKHTDTMWYIGDDIDFPESQDDEPVDGSLSLIFYLDGNIDSFISEVKNYLLIEQEHFDFFFRDVVYDIYNFKPITKEYIKQINPQIDYDIFFEKVSKIGYPIYK